MEVGAKENIEEGRGGDKMFLNDYTVKLSLAKLMNCQIKDCAF